MSRLYSQIPDQQQLFSYVGKKPLVDDGLLLAQALARTRGIFTNARRDIVSDQEGIYHLRQLAQSGVRYQWFRP